MPKVIQGIKFYDVKEAAEALDITPQTVRAYIKTGKLQATRIGRPFLIAEKSLKNIISPAVPPSGDRS